MNEVALKVHACDWQHRDTVDRRRPLWASVHQQAGQPEDMCKSLETYKLPRLSHREIERWNGWVTSKIDSVIVNLPTEKVPGPEGFRRRFSWMFKESTLILLKIFQIIKRGNSSKHVLLVQHYSDSRQGHHERRLQASVPDERKFQKRNHRHPNQKGRSETISRR